ncbi:hypothetical protein PanWU01x14_033090 [Parasponia andersonii]|uniref:Uncharacterized protein n=1 Tax=Parasponia andersonii TaxID=3476 RepID=A0A2P5DTK5_PARAD|nr:hypothetical protein PanWU01x14_033090 [Parasponia andersonii]
MVKTEREETLRLVNAVEESRRWKTRCHVADTEAMSMTRTLVGSTFTFYVLMWGPFAS